MVYSGAFSKSTPATSEGSKYVLVPSVVSITRRCCVWAPASSMPEAIRQLIICRFMCVAYFMNLKLRSPALTMKVPVAPAGMSSVKLPWSSVTVCATIMPLTV